MKKIKVGELRKYKKEEVNTNPVLNIGDMVVEVRQHTSILDKVDFSVHVYNQSVDTDGGLHIVNNMLHDMAYKIAIVKRYTNLTLPEDGVEAYDIITNTGLYNEILDMIPEIELDELNNTLKGYIDNKKQKYKQENSIGSITRLIIDTLTGIMPNAEDMEGILASVQGIVGKEAIELNSDVE